MGFGMYQLAENISRNLSVMSLNSNDWGEVVCVIGHRMYLIAFLPTWHPTAVSEFRKRDVEGSPVLLSLPREDKGDVSCVLSGI